MSKRKPRCNFPRLDEQKRAFVCGKPAVTTRDVGEGITFDACAECAATFDARREAASKAPPPAPPSKEAPALDLGELRQAVVSARVALDDLDFVTEDLMRPHRDRVWGYVTHAEKHGEARDSLKQALTFIERAIGGEPPPEPPPSDPAGSGVGGAGPVH